tara:strand:+ start:216 stop:404 length:189 start_codon:yes stop_codon:yes gene_type:complete
MNLKIFVKAKFNQVTNVNTDSGKMFRLFNALFQRLHNPDVLLIGLGILALAKMMSEQWQTLF